MASKKIDLSIRICIIDFSIYPHGNMSYLIKVYHGFRKGSVALLDFLNDISKTLENHPMTFGLHYAKGELFYSYHAKPKTYAAFESQFYSHFNDFQIVPDDKGAWYFDKGKSVL